MTGVGVAVFILVSGIAAGALIESLGGWWRFFWLFVGFWLLLGVVGLFSSLRKTHRDEKGKEIKEAPSKS